MGEQPGFFVSVQAPGGDGQLIDSHVVSGLLVGPDRVLVPDASALTADFFTPILPTSPEGVGPARLAAHVLVVPQPPGERPTRIAIVTGELRGGVAVLVLARPASADVVVVGDEPWLETIRLRTSSPGELADALAQAQALIPDPRVALDGVPADPDLVSISICKFVVWC
ncbi:MAG: hypothetical protein ACT4RN_05985 [Pseudonocardia sp.]